MVMESGKMKHELYDLLVKLGISKSDSFELFNNGVRDRNDINAYRCKNSGVIVLDSVHASNEDIYKEKKGMEYFQTVLINSDDEKRADVYKDIVRGKSWLDFGCGQGGPSLLLKSITKDAHGLELQEAPREYLNSKGIKCFGSLDEVASEYYDVITMFHVFEHLNDPISILNKCYEKLKIGGTLIIEVPSANDALLSLYENEAFRKFTLWSEHLLLHTRESLQKFVQESSFKVKAVQNVQRYPLSNHLYWLSKNKPGGHVAWSFLNTKEMEVAYENALSAVDKTDTIVAFCTKA